MGDLAFVMQHIAHVWVCDENRYPELAGKSDDARLNFLIKHSHLHISKTGGKIAAVAEKFDHEGVMSDEDRATLADNAVKLFVNALKFAETVGLTADDLLARAPHFVT